MRLTLFGAALSAPLLFFLVEKFLLGGGVLAETIFGVEFGWVEFLLATPVQVVLGYNTAMIPLASLGLLQLVLAAGAMAFSSVSVLSNSLLFCQYTPDHEYELLGNLRR